MRAIKIYQPHGRDSPFEAFLAQQSPKLRRKIRWMLFRMTQMELCELKEPHFKHFALERYGAFYELREKHQILVRIIFTIYDGDILLLAPFVKKESRDSRNRNPLIYAGGRDPDSFRSPVTNAESGWSGTAGKAA